MTALPHFGRLIEKQLYCKREFVDVLILTVRGVQQLTVAHQCALDEWRVLVVSLTILIIHYFL